MKIHISIFLALLTSSIAYGAELTGSPEELKQYLRSESSSIKVVGESEMVAYSDTAIVTIVVSNKAKTLSEALSENGAVRANLTQELLSSGFTDGDIQSTEFSSSPSYGLFGKRPSSYEVVNRLTVKSRDEQQLQRVSRIVDNSDESIIGAVVFENSSEEELKTKSELMALEDASRTANLYAEKLGLKLKAKSFSFDHSYSRPSDSSMVIEEIIVTARANRRDLSGSITSDSEPSFDEIKYEAKVTVEFEVVE